jgi:hypothetical protein
MGAELRPAACKAHLHDRPRLSHRNTSLELHSIDGICLCQKFNAPVSSLSKLCNVLHVQAPNNSVAKPATLIGAAHSRPFMETCPRAVNNHKRTPLHLHKEPHRNTRDTIRRGVGVSAILLVVLGM